MSNFNNFCLWGHHCSELFGFQALVHVSTAYCNCDRQVVEEIIHPPHADWREIISIVENTDEHTLDVLTQK
jgi:fatty acyl-CoA reductase